MTHCAGNRFACTLCIFSTSESPLALTRHYCQTHDIASRRVHAAQKPAAYTIKSDAPDENESFLLKIMTAEDYEYSDALLNVEQRGVCHVCGFARTYVEYATHCKAKHPRNHVVPFKFTCSECAASFVDPKSFDWHNSRLHAGKPRPLVAYVGKSLGSCCQVCMRVFQNNRTYLAHLRAHSDTFGCRLCDYKVYNWRLLRKHHFDRHNGQTYDFIFKSKPVHL